MKSELDFFEFVPETRKYWFLRTQGGTYYDEFASQGFIAIGWNEIDDAERLLTMTKDHAFKVINETYPDEERPGKIFNQLKRLYRDMRIDDVVMIPSNSSSRVLFGIIKSDVYIEKNISSGECEYIRRRRVDWIKGIDRERLDPYLVRMTRPHNAISDASEYATYIDRTIGSLYVKGTKAHMIIPIKTKHDISAVDLYDFMDLIFDTIPIINASNAFDKKYERSDLDIKLNLQSPGLMEYIANYAELMFGIGTVLVFVVGGSFRGKITKESKEVEAVSNGLIGKILEFLVKNKDQNIEIMKLKEKNISLQKKLDYELPKEIENPPEIVSEKVTGSDMEKISE